MAKIFLTTVCWWKGREIVAKHEAELDEVRECILDAATNENICGVLEQDLQTFVGDTIIDGAAFPA